MTAVLYFENLFGSKFIIVVFVAFFKNDNNVCL